MIWHWFSSPDSEERVCDHSWSLKAQNMCKELMFGVLHNNLPIYLSPNRDRLEQERKVTDTHRNLRTKVYRSKNCLLNFFKEIYGHGKSLKLWIKPALFWIISESLQHKIHSKRNKRDDQGSKVFLFLIWGLSIWIVPKSWISRLPLEGFLYLGIFSCTILYSYRKNPIFQSF